MADITLPKICTVYALVSSENSEIRYIGQTVRPLEARLRRHIQDAKANGRTPRDRWIRRVVSSGFEVRIVALLENAVHHKDEIRLIREYRKRGCDLLNLVDGGQGCLNPSPEYRAQMKAARKEFWNTAEGRAMASERSIRAWQDPDASRRRVDAIKSAFATPESKSKRSAAAKRIHKDKPWVRELAATRNRELWADPDHRKRRSDAIRQAMSSPEYRKALSERNSKHWEDPERRNKLSERMKGRKFSPETIQKMSEAAKRRYAEKGNPLKGRKLSEEQRQKLSEAQKKRFAEDPKAKESLQKALETRWENYRRRQEKQSGL